MLLKRSLWKNKYYIFIVTVLLLFSTRVWEVQPLILPSSLGFVDYIEKFVPILLIVPISFILYDSYEIELSLVCGVKTTKLVFTNFFVFFIYLLTPSIAIILCHNNGQPLTLNNKSLIPIYIPQNYMLYLIISTFIIILFFSSLFLFLRVVCRNCYMPLIIGIVVYMIFNNINTLICDGIYNIKACLFDPFISTYLIGNHIPNTYYSSISGMQNAWTYNRLLFLGTGVLMFVLTYILLRREKLHEGFGD